MRNWVLAMLHVSQGLLSGHVQLILGPIDLEFSEGVQVEDSTV